jgi:hypothetical protein
MAKTAAEVRGYIEESKGKVTVVRMDELKPKPEVSDFVEGM